MPNRPTTRTSIGTSPGVVRGKRELIGEPSFTRREVALAPRAYAVVGIPKPTP
jgi:hypothetical protein